MYASRKHPTPLPQRPLPRWQRVLRLLLIAYLLVSSGFLEWVPLSSRWLEFISLIAVVVACLVILYAILNDCRKSRRSR